MTSQVNPNNIDGTYPVAGQDNDSQGFRDNFTNIRNNFTYIKSEVEDLQNKSVLKSALTNTTLDNNLLGNAIVGASLTQWRENFNDIGAVSGSITVDFTNGNFQKITMNGSTTLAFSFPSNTSGQYASVKLWVHVETAAYTLTLPSSVTLGDPDTIAGLAGTSPPIITFNSAELANATDFFFEFYTFNSGTTIGIKDLTRNRDVDLSGLSITGNLTLDGLTVSTYNSTIASNVSLGSAINATTGSNVVVRSNVGSTSTTTGALVVAGGVGIAGNVFINGNLIINGGIINPDYFLANVVTGQNLFANVNYNRFIANASPTGTVANLFITLPNSVEDGRELEFTTMTAITACFISNMTPGVTSVYGLANTWAGSASITNSVSIKLMYSATVGRWFKV